MSDAQLYQAWARWLVVGGVLVVVAASLLIWILFLARAIAVNATRALCAAEKIAGSPTLTTEPSTNARLEARIVVASTSA